MNKLESHINETVKKNKLVKINNNIYLTNYEIEILKMHKINYLTCSNYQNILFFLEEELEQTDDTQELEQIILSISERHYYQNTHK